MKIRRIQPRAYGWWGDDDCGINVRIWGEPTPQGTIKVSYITDYEYFEFVPVNEVTEYPEGAYV
jgi:hypothetical protein